MAVLAVCLAPLAALTVEVAAEPGAAGRAVAALAGGRVFGLLASSAGLASGSTLIAVTVGVPLGVLLGHTDLPGRRFLLVLHAVPAVLPPFLLALGGHALLGLSGTGGAILVLGLAHAPIVTGLVAAALAGVDASMEEAARTLAPPGRVVTGILLPLAGPAVGLGALVAWALSFGELGVPMYLRVPAFPAAVFARLGGVEASPGEAFALVLPLLAVAALLLVLERRLGRGAQAVLGHRSESRSPLPLSRWRLPALVLAAGWIALGLSPVAALAARAGVAGFAALPQWLGAAPWNSALTAAAAATAITALAVVVGHAIAREARGARLLDAAAVLAFLTPASLLGLGLITLWNRPATDLVYGTPAILVLAFAARYAAVGIRASALAVAQAPAHLEEAAAVMGAGYLRRLTRVVLPATRRGLGAAWLFALGFCLRDLETCVLLYPAGREPLPVRIFTLEANGSPAVVASLACAHVVLTLVLLSAAAALLTGRRPR